MPIQIIKTGAKPIEGDTLYIIGYIDEQGVKRIKKILKSTLTQEQINSIEGASTTLKGIV